MTRLRADSLILDIRYAARTLRRSPAFTATAIATLAIGIGLNATVFTVTNAVLFSGFRSLEGNDRILYIGTQKDGRGCCVSYPDFLDWQAQITSFTGLAAVADRRVAVVDEAGTQSYIATEITPGAFQLLGVTPAIGRDFTAADAELGAPPVAILSHRLWARRFGANPSAVARVVRVNGVATTIIGVMGDGFAFPQNQDLWLPLTASAARQDRANRGLWFAFGRLTDGATVAEANAELGIIGGNLARAYPATNDGWRPELRTFAEFFISKTAPTTYRAMWGAVGFVVLIACANLANLMLARAAGRSREFGVRLALGAGRFRIVRQLAIEGLLLAAVAGVIGWWIAEASVRFYAQWANPPGRLWSENLVTYVIDTRVFAYVAALSVVAGLVIGLLPALRLSTRNVGSDLKEAGGRGATSGRHGTRIVGALVVAEMALAVVLLSGAGVMSRSLLNLTTVDLGIDPTNTLAMLVNLPPERYGDGSAQHAFFERLDARLRSVPGIGAVSLASTLPTGGTQTLAYDRTGVAGDGSRPTVSVLTIAPDYFAAFGVRALAGREFTAADGESSAPAVIVNEAFAQQEWPGQDPIGRRVWFDPAPADGSRMVVGVVPNVLQNDPLRTRQQFEPAVYFPYRQQPRPNMWVIARTLGEPASVAPTFRREVQSLDPELAVWLDPMTVEQHLAGYGNYWVTGTATVLFVIFAGVGVTMAAIGLYGVLAQSIAQRTQEIGVRMAIGASPYDMLRLVLRRGFGHVAIGLAIGLAASPALTNLLASFLVHVSPTDPASLGLASLLLVLVATCGCVVPARRAMRVDPVVALRSE